MSLPRKKSSASVASGEGAEGTDSRPANKSTQSKSTQPRKSTNTSGRAGLPRVPSGTLLRTAAMAKKYSAKQRERKEREIDGAGAQGATGKSKGGARALAGASGMWRPSNNADKIVRDVLPPTNLSPKELERQRDREAMEIEGTLRQWFEPWWRRAVPNSLEDVLDDHRQLTLNYMCDKGWWIDCYDDSPSTRGQRVQRHWDGESTTITMLNGGKAWFPPEEWKTMLRYYAYDLNFVNRCPLYMNQIVRGQPVFKLALDLDFKSATAESADYLVSVVRCIHTDVLVRYYPHRSSTLRCTVAMSKSCRDDPLGRVMRCLKSSKLWSEEFMMSRNDDQLPSHGNEAIGRFHEDHGTHNDTPVPIVEQHKAGVHPYWNVYVTVDQACQLVESAVAALESKFGPRPEGQNSWRQVLDIQPILNGMLRMVGSIKMTACLICRRWPDLKPTCPGCHGSGHVNDDRPYMPACVLVGAKGRRSPKLLEAMRKDNYAMMLECTMHAEPGQAAECPFVVPEGEPIFVPLSTPTFHARIQLTDGTFGTQTSREFRADTRNYDKRALVVPQDDVRFRIIEQLIREVTIEPYAQCTVRRVRVRSRGQCPIYTIEVGGRGQHYCQKIKRYHNSNRIYFVASRSSKPPALSSSKVRGYSITQRCFDIDCKGFVSEPFDIDDRFARRTLFHVGKPTHDPTAATSPNAASSADVLAMAAESMDQGTRALDAKLNASVNPIPTTTKLAPTATEAGTAIVSSASTSSSGYGPVRAHNSSAHSSAHSSARSSTNSAATSNDASTSKQSAQQRARNRVLSQKMSERDSNLLEKMQGMMNKMKQFVSFKSNHGPAE